MTIDHIVMTVADMSKTIEFYNSVLGTTAVEFMPPTGGPPRQSLHFGTQKINLHDAASPYVPHAHVPQAGSVDLCFISAQPLSDWQTHLASHAVEIEQGPCLLYTSPSPRDRQKSRMPSSA